MGPPPAARLASRRSSGKAVGEMADCERADAPPGSDRSKGLENEAAAGQPKMGNGERAGAKFAAAPQRDIEIEDAGPPAASRAAAECALEALQAPEHLGRIQVALDQRDR